MPAFLLTTASKVKGDNEMMPKVSVSAHPPPEIILILFKN